jgi:hypothetical protein
MSWAVGLGAAAVGALVGLAELVSRYREVRLIWRSPAAYAYLALNASAALLAVHFFDSLIKNPLELAIASGVGAMALFRTSLFVVRVGDSDVAIGPGGFLQLLLAAADRGVDRLLGARRSRVVASIMSDVSFAKAYQSLPVSCLNLVQGIPAAEQQALGQDIRDLLSNVSIPDSSKAYNLGLIMIQAVGEDVLREAVAALGASIVNDRPPALGGKDAEARRAA